MSRIVELPSAVDGWLIDRVAQPVLNELGRRFGVERVWVMRVAGVALFVAITAQVLAFPRSGHPADGFDLGAIAIFGILTAWIMVSAPSSGSAQRLSPIMFILRLMWLIYIGNDAVSAILVQSIDPHRAASDVADVFGALWSYFGACENPPKKQVRRKLAFARG